jgi:hypothetical protein
MGIDILVARVSIAILEVAASLSLDVGEYGRPYTTLSSWRSTSMPRNTG